MQNNKKESFVHLTEYEHIIQRFSMYGGSRDIQEETVFLDAEFTGVNIVMGLLKVINEIIDNSIDEHIKSGKKAANKIEVTIDKKDGMITVKDNGRGIPVDMITCADGERRYRMVAAYTMARAGSNFDDNNRISIGMNGIGSTITYVTSNDFHATSCDGKHVVDFRHDKTISQLQTPIIKKSAVNTGNKQKRGTIVSFIPDYGFFGLSDGMDDIHEKMIMERIKSLSISFPSINFHFNGKKITSKFVDYFGGDNIELFLLAAGDDDGGGSTSTTYQQWGIGQSHNSGTFETYSLVNGLAIKCGTHIDYYITPIIHELKGLIKKKHKIDISSVRLKQHLRLCCVINGFASLKFDSQTKVKITNSISECKKQIGNVPAVIIAKKLLCNKNLIDDIIAHARLKEDLLNKKDLQKLQKKKKVISDKYFSAIGKCERLFICEGFSASGAIMKCMGRKGNAFYALKGVPLNVLEVSPQKFMANKELSELFAIINTNQNIDICIASDADADGSRIRGLLMLFMYKYFPERVERNKLRVLKTPIAIARKKGKIVDWVYDFDDVSKLKKSCDLSYVKGLGSWTSSDLQHVISVDTIQKMLPFVDVMDGDDDLLKNWFSNDTIDFRKDQILSAEPFDIMRV